MITPSPTKIFHTVSYVPARLPVWRLIFYFAGEADWSAVKHSLWPTHRETFIMVS